MTGPQWPVMESLEEKQHHPSLFLSRVQAGFPSPAEDYRESPLDLNELLIKRPAATFFVRAAGSSMIGAGIYEGDILIVDRSITASPGRVVIAILDGEFTVKRLGLRGTRPLLLPENPDYPVIEIRDGSDFEIWGVVTHSIHETV